MTETRWMWTGSVRPFTCLAPAGSAGIPGAAATVAAAHEKDFPKVATFTIDELFGGWKKAQETHFNDGGTFDQIYKPGN